MNSSAPARVQLFSYFFILDIEATLDSPPEVVDFACLKFNTETLQIDGTYRRVVRPFHRPILSNRSLRMSGITQEMVDKSPSFRKAWPEFIRWYRQKKENKTSAFLTISNWDIQQALRAQSMISKTYILRDFKSWINLQKTYCRAYNFFPRDVKFMLSQFRLPFQGSLNHAMDDVLNAATVVRRMLRENIIFNINNEDMVELPTKRPDQMTYVPPKIMTESEPAYTAGPIE